MKDHARLLAPGFLAHEWVDPATAAEELKLPCAALRFCSQGLEIESGSVSLGRWRERVSTIPGSQGDGDLTLLIASMRPTLEKDGLAQAARLAEPLRRWAPVPANALSDLFSHMNQDEENNLPAHNR